MLAWQPSWLESAYVVTDVPNAGIDDTVSTELLYTVRVCHCSEWVAWIEKACGGMI